MKKIGNRVYHNDGCTLRGGGGLELLCYDDCGEYVGG